MTDTAMLGAGTYERLPNDAYNTPTWCTEALIENISLPKQVWEPAAGMGAMLDVLEAYGYDVLPTDITDVPTVDFLKVPLAHLGYDAIVTNPPYSLANEFVRHALHLMKRPAGMVAMLLRNEFDSARRRADLFADNPCFAMKLVLTKRPRWIDGTTTSPRHNFAWYIWNYKHKGPPTIRWAP